MHSESNCFIEKKFNDRQEILEEFGKAWRWAGRIEREARELLSNDDPISENLGYANVSMMNAYYEIEDIILKSGSNKLESITLVQILDVLTRIKWTGTETDRELIEAYQTAVKDVANFHKIHRNTIADGCCRRLQLTRDGFLDIVKKWLAGESDDLQIILKRHAYSSKHSLLEDFFQGKGAFRENY